MFMAVFGYKIQLFVYHRSPYNLVYMLATNNTAGWLSSSCLFSLWLTICIPQWTSNLGFNVAEQWRPWMVDDQVAGYVTKYDTNGFTFITVKGSGHMVPQYRPKQAFAMFERFLKQQPF